MASRGFAREEAELARLEAELTTRLTAELEKVISGKNTNFFFTPEYNPHNFPEQHVSRASAELLEIARKTVNLRKQLVMPINQCVGYYFEAACVECADLDNPNRLGPKRLAERLLGQIRDQLDG
jgi:hypothetical protein